MKKLFAILVVVAFAFSSCGKYEDGPVFSLASKKSRLVNVWQLDKEFHNGQEQQLTADDKDDFVEYTKDNKLIITVNTNVLGQTVTNKYEGTWAFDDKKENIITEFNVNGMIFKDTLRILRLKSNELWVEEKQGNDVYKYYYVTKK